MKKIEVEIMSDKINCPVVQLPGRRFPGILIQGDSLSILLDCAEDVAKLTASSDDEKLKAVVDDLKDKLSGYVQEYEATLKAHSLDLPYSK